jgi:hypothetical protein
MRLNTSSRSVFPVPFSGASTRNSGMFPETASRMHSVSNIARAALRCAPILDWLDASASDASAVSPTNGKSTITSLRSMRA